MRRLLVLALLLPAGCSGGDERAATLERTSGPARIAFVLNVRGDTDLYVLRRDGSGRELLARTPELNEGAMSWSPDGRLLAFDATPPERGGWASDVWVTRADGSGRRRLTENREPDVGPGWTADGRVVFTSSDLRGDELPDCRLEAVRPDGSGRETLADGLGPGWHADRPPGRDSSPTRVEAGSTRCRLLRLRPA